jgi:hypothetical protein
MLIASSSFAPELQPFCKLQMHVLPAYSLFCDSDFASHLAWWTPGESDLTPREDPSTVIELPADRAVICRAPGPGLCLARPALIPRLFAAPALPLEASACPPPRIAGDLALEQGFAVRSPTVRVLQEDFEDFGGSTHLGVFQVGHTHSYSFVKQTNAAGGRQSWEGPRFLWQSERALRPMATTADSVIAVFNEMYRRTPTSSQSRYRLRLIASLEQPWGWNEWLDVWSEWARAASLPPS